jgi:hypothetical protein
MLKYGWQNRSAYPGGVFLVEADNVDRLRRSFAAIAYRMDSSKSPKVGATHAAVAACVSKLLNSIKKRWLLLVDGANHSDVIDLLSTVYLPKDGDLLGGHMLFSSRVATPAAWTSLGVSEPMTLTNLDPRQSAELLVRYAREMYKATTWEVEQVVDHLEPSERAVLHLLAGTDARSGLNGVPCALQQVGAYMLRTQCTFAQYHELLVTMGETLGPNVGKTGSAVGADGDDGLARSATTWAINMDGLSVGARRVLSAIACLQPFQIPEPLLVNIARVDHARNRVESGTILEGSASDGEAPTKQTSDMVHAHFDTFFIDELVAAFAILQLDYKTQ